MRRVFARSQRCWWRHWNLYSNWVHAIECGGAHKQWVTQTALAQNVSGGSTFCVSLQAPDRRGRWWWENFCRNVLQLPLDWLADLPRSSLAKCSRTTKPVNRLGLGRRGCCWWTGPSAKCSSRCALHVLRRLDFIARVARDRCVPFGDKQVVFTGNFFRFPPVPNAEDDWWFCFRSPLWSVIIPLRTHVILSPIYRQEDAAFPAFLCGLRVGMLTRRSCMGIRGWLRLAPALAQATFTARTGCSSVCTATTPVYKNRFHLH